MFKKYVALDVGDVRIGVAKSDIMGILATPLEVIDNRKKTSWEGKRIHRKAQ